MKNEFIKELSLIHQALKSDLADRTSDIRIAHESALRLLIHEVFSQFLQRTPLGLDGARLPETTVPRFEIDRHRRDEIHGFLRRSKFALNENRLLIKDDVIGPEILGIICERFAPVSEDSDERGATGVFYTPRTEIDLMCRLALADYLANHLGRESRGLVRDAVFALESNDKKNTDKALSDAGQWQKVYEYLSNVMVLDPACGAGSFLVEMLGILDDLGKRANRQLRSRDSGVSRRKTIIESNLFGADICSSACLAAKLRLWLALFSDDETSEKITEYGEYQLERCSFNIGCGDILTSFPDLFPFNDNEFDIVIGNPPYVRQENIADPYAAQNITALASRKEYKSKIARSIHERFPHYFGPNPHKPERKIDARSDLYVYFFFLGLGLLKPCGTFCFITSSSWLDAGYGRALQEFLLRQCRIKLILDDERRRSFIQADVNTVITLLSAPSELPDRGLSHTARFATFTAPFEEVISSKVFREIESAEERITTREFRVRPICQASLLDDGLWKRHGVALRKAGYSGDKWGGKYLRAPDIYWTILEKARGKLVRLRDVASVRRGITTGANEFFYLKNDDAEKWDVEPEYLKTLVKSSREIRSFRLQDPETKTRVFLCEDTKESLEGTQALEYIKSGERKGFDRRPTCAARNQWWSLGNREPLAIISPCSINDLYRVSLNLTGVLVDKRLYEIHPISIETNQLAACLNCTLTSLFLELGTRTGLGEGLLDMTVYEVANCPVVSPGLIGDVVLFDRDVMNYERELADPERRELDGAMFDALGLSGAEIDDIYDAVAGLIEKRLSKAQTPNTCGTFA